MFCVFNRERGNEKFMKYNEKISYVEPSKSVTLLAKTKELQKTDRSIINLTGR